LVSLTVSCTSLLPQLTAAVQLATPETEKVISSIAVCAGSGGSVLSGAKADLLITGEMSHHEVLAYVAGGQSVILANHSNTERPYLSAILQGWLEKELNADEQGWEVVVSKVDADPLRTV
jgi:putative NIF3 family GTP cyclohydrolase 1 type 2